jgi:hypothetical protein
MARQKCEIKIIPAPEGWGVYCKTHSFRTGPFTKRPDADRAAEAHRLSASRDR